MAAKIIPMVRPEKPIDKDQETDRHPDVSRRSQPQQQFIAAASRLVSEDYPPVARAGQTTLKDVAFALMRATRSDVGGLPLPQRDLLIAIAHALLCEAGERELDREGNEIWDEITADRDPSTQGPL
jgi:hypothetical protein